MKSQSIRRRIDIPKSDISLNDLLEIERTSEQKEVNADQLPLSSLIYAPNAFQIRQERTGERLLNREHVRELMTSIMDHQEPLSPIKVLPLAGKFYVIDGHHRHVAYRSVGWEKDVPVTCFNGTVYQAELEAGLENHRDKLPVSKESKLEFAWTLVLRDQHSISEIHRASGRAKRTISYMRKRRRELMEAGEEPFDYSWKGAQQQTKRTDYFDHNKFILEESQSLARRIGEDQRFKIVKWPEVLAEAIQILSPDLPRILVERWSDIAINVVQQMEDEGYMELDI